MPGSRGGGVGVRPVNVTSIVTGTLLVLTLATAGSTALCPTPESHALSSVILLQPGNDTQLTWGPVPQGTEARYSCDPGFLSVGVPERVCRSDGDWSGAAPYCYLNIASQTSLTAYVELVDANLSTYIELSELARQDVELYDVTAADSERAHLLPSVREIRFITGGEQDLTGWTIFITKPSLGDPCDGQDQYPVSTEINGMQPYMISVEGNQLWMYTFLTKACFKRILIREPGTTRKKDSSLPAALVSEIQLVTENTAGVSRHQCRVPAGRDGDLLTSWAAGELCYHLVRSRLSHADADQWCQQLGSRGQLLQLYSAGLHSLVEHVLRQQTTINSWSNEFVWMAGGRHDGAQSQNSPVPKYVSEAEPVNNLGIGFCRGVQQIQQWKLASDNCEENRMFICQTAPSECGSPAVAAGLRYDPPPSASLRTANVTCAGHHAPSGTVHCRDRRWTQPTFCDAGGVLGPVLGAVAGTVLLLGCVLLAVASYMRHKRDNEGGWEDYTYIRRLSRLSRYGSGQQGLDVSLVAGHAYSEPVTRDGSALQGTQQRPASSSWLHGQQAGPGCPRRGDTALPPPPLPTSSPPSSAGLVNPHYRVPSPDAGPPPAPGAGSTPPAVEYCVPLVQARRHSPKLSFADRSTDGAAVAGDEYAVPYDARRQGASERVGVPPDVVTSAGGV